MQAAKTGSQTTKIDFLCMFELYVFLKYLYIILELNFPGSGVNITEYSTKILYALSYTSNDML